MRRGQRGNSILETALFVPVLVILLVGMVQIGKVTYVYYTLKKTMHAAARYLATQQGVNFCDSGDAAILAAKNFALTGQTEPGAALPLLPQLTADMIGIRAERVDAASGALGECECSQTGCDAAQGGQPPDFIVVSITDGYQVLLRIPYLQIDPILLRPEARVPFGGT